MSIAVNQHHYQTAIFYSTFSPCQVPPFRANVLLEIFSGTYVCNASCTNYDFYGSSRGETRVASKSLHLPNETSLANE